MHLSSLPYVLHAPAILILLCLIILNTKILFVAYVAFKSGEILYCLIQTANRGYHRCKR